ncbi:MAG: hypothetical protein AAFU71_08415 [Cyanobacteria bacterium J06632_22]
MTTTSTPKISAISLALWVGVICYVGLLLLSPPSWLPGEPVWAIKPETLQEIFDESLNFFFVLPILNHLGLNLLSAPVVHPASEAFFNVAEAWIFMFLPLILRDAKGRHLPQVAIWSLAMFLTNVFLMPYMALRREARLQDTAVPGWVEKLFGLIGLVVGTLAVGWFVFARPAFGGLDDRGAYFIQQVLSNRVTLAFCVDLGLFWLFQTWLMGAVMATGAPRRWLRWVPLWGLALWLLDDCSRDSATIKM